MTESLALSSYKLKRTVWQDPFYFIAFGFGSGLVPFMPGTFGTLAAIPIYLLMKGLSPFWYLTWVVLLFLFGVFICQKVSDELKVYDHCGIVFDEIVGFLLTLFLVPFSLKWMVIGFILFRAFDILKPPPIAQIEKRFQNGFGVMIDDVIAAICSWLILQGLILIFN